MTALTYNELMDVFFDYTQMQTGLDSKQIRQSYQLNSAPFANIKSPTVYYYISYTNSPVINQINETLTDNGEDKPYTREYWHMRELQVSWSFYGYRDIVDIARMFRTKFYSIKGKQFLDKYKIKLITDIPEINVVPEIINNTWWLRADLNVNFYHYNMESEEIPRLEGIEIGFVPNPTQPPTIEDIDNDFNNGNITPIDKSSTLYRMIELDIEELKEEAEKGGNK